MRERAKREESATVASPLPLTLFTTTVDTHQAALYGFLRGMLGDDEAARDLTQDTFSDAWRATQAREAPWSADHDADERRRWLFSIAYRRAISHLRRRSIIRWASLDASADPATRDVVYSSVESQTPFETRIVEAEALRAALRRLHPDDAACLLLRVAQGFSGAETATVLGISEEAAAQRLSRARRRLRAIYLQQNPSDEPASKRSDDHE
ncbi:MAG TPA: RNA polymerase sigma factor [Ktedonobacterales bacterium]